MRYTTIKLTMVAPTMGTTAMMATAVTVIVATTNQITT